MIQLFKKNIWNDHKTVNIIAQACFNDYYKVKLAACYFLISTTEISYLELSDEDEDEDDDNVLPSAIG